MEVEMFVQSIYLWPSLLGSFYIDSIKLCLKIASLVHLEVVALHPHLLYTLHQHTRTYTHYCFTKHALIDAPFQLWPFTLSGYPQDVLCISFRCDICGAQWLIAEKTVIHFTCWTVLGQHTARFYLGVGIHVGTEILFLPRGPEAEQESTSLW